VLFLLELDFRRRPHPDDRYAAAQLGQTLLQLFPVIVRRRRLDLRPDLLYATANLCLRTHALDDRRIVLGRDHTPRLTQVLQRRRLQLPPHLLRDHFAARQHRDVPQHLLAAIAKGRRLDRHHVEHAPQLVQHQRRQRLAVDVLGYHQQVPPARLHHLFQQRHQVLRRADLFVIDQHVRVLENGLRRVCVGDKVRRDVPAVELHTLDILNLELQPLGLFHRDDAVLADLVHHVRDQVADLHVRG